MFTKSMHLFRLFGFSIRVDWSWLILAVLITGSLAYGVFPAYYPSWDVATYWLMGITGAVGLFLSIVLHELGHALVARRNGVRMNGITLFVFGGVAEMQDEPPSPRAELLIAIGGPIVSLGIAIATFGFATATALAGGPLPLVAVAIYLSYVNGLLLAFNLIPAFPLDGGRVLRAVLWHFKHDLKSATRITTTIGSFFGVALIVLGIVSFLGGNFLGGMWWAVLGLFLRGAAQMSYQQLLVKQALQGEPISRVMHSDVHTVPPTVTLQQFVDDYVYRYHHKMFPVTDNGHLLGCVSTENLRKMPPQEWPAHEVREIAEPCSDTNTIAASTDATAALSKLDQAHGRLLVVDHDHLEGVVSARDLMKFVSLKAELGLG